MERRFHPQGRKPYPWAMRGFSFQLLAVLLVPLTTLSGCDRAPLEPLDVLWPVPDFTFTDQAGAPLSNVDLEGRVWAADFFFTTCPAICPLLTRSMGEVRDAIADELADGEAALVGFSLQPEHDTPDVLAAYGQSHGAEPGRWYLLTGERADIWRICQEDGFKLHVNASDDPNNPIAHDGRISLVDRRGQVRGVYDGLNPEAMRQLTRDMKRLLDDPKL